MSLNVSSIADPAATCKQSVTSRLEASLYRDFSQFFESIGLNLENFGLEKSLGMSQLLLLGKFEYGGGPIFKVVLEC